MPITPGSKLSFYEVVAPLGAGAMGEVWRARDTRLGREVAIKVLPEHFAEDAERLARFEREARSLAALNHPNVAQIHGVDQVDETFFLVLELVPGESLEERLARGRLPLDEALDVCRQIAEGLEAAHEAGVIHRDLKPANVRLTPDGKVKVLDFGLAKPMHAGREGSGTDSVLSTEAGRLLGTPTYMAPEQARGRPIDRRVDVWAFGCVLYECLCARRAFAGETLTDVFAAVLEREPDWSALPAATPTRVRELLERCLAKDPRRRLRDVGEARILLEEPATGAMPRAHGPTRAARLLPWALCAVLACVVALLALRGERVPAPPARLLAFSRLTDLPGPETHPDLSPDGNTLLFVASGSGNRDIHALRVGGNRVVNLTQDSPADDTQPRFSRDGQWIVFRSERDGGGLFVMGATGENLRRLTDRGYDPCWSPDGKEVAFADELVDDPYYRRNLSALWSVELASGAVRPLCPGDAVQPDWSPDGRWIACWSNPTGQRDLILVPAAGGEPVAVTADAATDWSPAWMAGGTRLAFSSDRGGSMNIWSVAIDPATGHPVGEPRPETNGVRNLGYARFSADGTRMTSLAFERAVDVSVYRFDAQSLSAELLHALPRQALELSSVTPDGRWIVGSTTESREDLVLLRADGGELRKLTSDPAKDRTARVSPDGRTILFKSTRSGRWQPWTIRIDGSGLTRVGELEIGELLCWGADGTRAYAYDWLDHDRMVLVPLDLDEIALPSDLPERRMDPALTGLICWTPGPRPQTLLAEMPRADGTIGAIGLFDLGTRVFTPFRLTPVEGSEGYAGGVLPGSQHAVLLTQEGVIDYDLETGRWRPITGVSACDNLLVSADGSTLVTTREVYDGDVWLGELR